MILEARIGFILLFLLTWSVIAIIPWAISAIATRGRGALLLLPIVILTAVTAGFIVPLAGQRDVTGFWISLAAALFGAIIASAAGAALIRRVLAEQAEETPKSAARPTRRSTESATAEELTPDA